MGTRCNIVLKCGDQRKYIYRHYDGYPSSVEPELKKCAEAIRWYSIEASFAPTHKMLNFYADLLVKHHELLKLEGKYEVTNGIHGDIDYKYTITIDDSTHKVCSMEFTPARENPRNPYATLESAWQGF